MKKVTIYSTDYCPYCRMAEKFFKAQNISFESIDVTHDDAARLRLVETTGKKTVPQIFIGETPIGGYSDLMVLFDNDELLKKLA